MYPHPFHQSQIIANIPIWWILWITMEIISHGERKWHNQLETRDIWQSYFQHTDYVYKVYIHIILKCSYMYVHISISQSASLFFPHLYNEPIYNCGDGDWIEALPRVFVSIQLSIWHKSFFHSVLSALLPSDNVIIYPRFWWGRWQASAVGGLDKEWERVRKREGRGKGGRWKGEEGGGGRGWLRRKGKTHSLSY